MKIKYKEYIKLRVEELYIGDVFMTKGVLCLVIDPYYIEDRIGHIPVLRCSSSMVCYVPTSDIVHRRIFELIEK